MTEVNWDTLPFSREQLERYLLSLLPGQVQALAVRELRGEQTLKEFGYGEPLLLECVHNGEEKLFVLHTVSRDGFGHERRPDRAANLLLDHATFNRLPRHVSSRDVGAFGEKGGLISLGDAGEFFHLTDYAKGTPYASDLHRIADTNTLTRRDTDRTIALADYLADIHAVRESDALLYRRRIRDLIGHGEGIMGIVDSYPSDFAPAPPDRLEAIERQCLRWRWKIKDSVHRLSQVHGDFHPWNVLFREGTEFVLLDRSRGAWGEPADDVSAMSINYIFFSLRQSGKLVGPFRELYDLFWDHYLDRTGDDGLLSVIQPFYTWRALVVASPVWYPSLEPSVREALLRFVESVLDVERFDPRRVDDQLP